MNTKQLDLAQFEPMVWDEQRSETSHAYASQRLYAAMKDCIALLSECRLQRRIIEELRAELATLKGTNEKATGL